MIDLPNLQITGRTDSEKINQLIAYNKMLRDSLDRVLSCIDTCNLSAPLAEKIGSISTTDLKEYVRRPELNQFARLSQLKDGECDYKTDRIYDSTGDMVIMQVLRNDGLAETFFNAASFGQINPVTIHSYTQIDLQSSGEINLMIGADDDDVVSISGTDSLVKLKSDHRSWRYSGKEVTINIPEAPHTIVEMVDGEDNMFKFEFDTGKIWYNNEVIAEPQ